MTAHVSTNPPSGRGIGAGSSRPYRHSKRTCAHARNIRCRLRSSSEALQVHLDFSFGTRCAGDDSVRHVTSASHSLSPWRNSYEHIFITWSCFRPRFRCYMPPRHQPWEINAVIKASTWGMGASATAALMMFSLSAFAQQPATPPAAPKATAPAPAAPAATPAAPAEKGIIAKAADKAKAVAKSAKEAAVKVAAPSPCKGLDQPACGAKGAECGWIVPKKVDAKTGKADQPYCRKVAGVAKKAADAKAAAAAPAKAAAPVGTPAPAVVKAPAAPAAPAAPKPAAPKAP